MKNRPKQIRGLILIAAALCGGCAYVTDGAVQDVTVLTPGANNAECKLSVGSVQYIYAPPMTRSIQKSGENMVVDCWAPGNRHKVVHLKPDVGSSTFYNAPMGMAPGFAWDYASNSIYKYPAVVEVDFTQTQIKPFPLPAQNQPDIRPPEDYDLEEFSPGLPRLNSDRFATKTEVRRRQVPSDFDLQGFAGYEDTQGTSADLGGPVTGPAAAGTAAGAESSGSPMRRVIGRMNEGVAVPTPPSPAEQAASAAARAAERAAEAASEAASAAESAASSEESGTGAAAPSGESIAPSGDAENLLPPEN